MTDIIDLFVHLKVDSRLNTTKRRLLARSTRSSAYPRSCWRTDQTAPKCASGSWEGCFRGFCCDSAKGWRGFLRLLRLLAALRGGSVLVSCTDIKSNRIESNRIERIRMINVTKTQTQTKRFSLTWQTFDDWTWQVKRCHRRHLK